MITHERGDVVLVPFPFSDQTAVKKRPAVVISPPKYNSILQDLIIIAITGNTTRIFPLGELSIVQWEQAGLLKPSSIKPAVATIEQRMVLKKLGRLQEPDLKGLKELLRELFG